jgi:chemotaxis protein CheX
MDAKYINPFLVAIKDIFDTMIDLPVTIGKPFIKKDKIPSYEVSSIIGLSGPVIGCVAISFSEQIALQLAGALLEEEFVEIDDDCTDAIGEIANMIAGNAKSAFPVDNASISVPSVIIGKHSVSYPSGIPVISIPCESGGGSLSVDVALKESG